MDKAPVWSPRAMSMLLGIAVCAAGLAIFITVLNLAGRAVMELGGFVASGGPYAIVQPAPGWIGIVPLSLFTGFACGGWSAYLSHRTGGFSLLPPAWTALFVSLGIQFAIMGLNPPGDTGIAWGWIICAILFVPMGLVGLLVSLGRDSQSGAVQGLLWYGHRARPYDDDQYRAAYTLLVLLGAAAGVYAAFTLFARVAR